MTKITETQIHSALSTIIPQGQNKDIISLGLVNGIVIQKSFWGANIAFTIEIQPPMADEMEALKNAAEKAVLAIKGVKSAKVILTAHKSLAHQQMNTSPAHSDVKTSPFSPAVKAQNPITQPEMAVHKTTPKPSTKIRLENVRHIIAVASGKGGVGKSTTAVNLATALSRMDLKVGLLDADIFGPSIPRLLGLNGKPETGADSKLIPKKAFGVSCMSIGFLAEENTPIVLRGPMVQNALLQMIRGTNWGPLDILIIDMPPGTGDVQLTLAQQLPISGAVIVSTPQDLALIDARKAIGMFQKVSVPILGLIENMSYFLCPHCHGRSEIFSHGGAAAEAQKMDMPFLGEVPLELEIRQLSDAGTPAPAISPEKNYARIYTQIADQLIDLLAAGQNQKKPPLITMN